MTLTADSALVVSTTQQRATARGGSDIVVVVKLSVRWYKLTCTYRLKL